GLVKIVRRPLMTIGLLAGWLMIASVCLRSCNNSFGILDVFRRFLRYHWRRGMARCILPVWNRGGCPESSRAIHRAEDLVSAPCSTFEKIGPTRCCTAIKFRSLQRSHFRLNQTNNTQYL